MGGRGHRRQVVERPGQAIACVNAPTTCAAVETSTLKRRAGSLDGHALPDLSIVARLHSREGLLAPEPIECEGEAEQAFEGWSGALEAR